MEHIEDLVRGRRSVRTFDGNALSLEDKEKLQQFMSSIENPFGIKIQFSMLSAAASGLKSPVIVGTDSFVGGKVKRIPHAEEAFGYSMEMLVLYAQSLGIGTTWIGGTMDRSAFERAMQLEADEKMPCVTPVGYPAPKMSLRESMMRKGVRADDRVPFETLFFDGSFSNPLKEEKAGSLRKPLEMVRLAPSAVNKQPWRVLVADHMVHFYEKSSKGFVSDAVGDMQKIDLGIALCHFALAAQEQGLSLAFSMEAPSVSCPEDYQYIASFTVEA